MHAEQKIQRLLQLIKETKQEADSTRPEGKHYVTEVGKMDAPGIEPRPFAPETTC